jgi:glycosyltransferase involved in cell wall biosynthesis
VKVLFISPLGRLGGAERSLLDMLAALRLVHPSIELAVIAFAPGPLLDRASVHTSSVSVVELPAELAELGEGATLHHGIVDRASLLVGFLRRLAHQISAEKPDIVHTNGIKAHVLASATCLRPMVFHFRDFMRERPMSRRALLPFTLLGRRAAVANSDAVARDVALSFPRLSVQAVLNAIDLQEFSPGPADPLWLARCADLPRPSNGTVSFGLAAAYARWKGQDLFLRAAARFRAQRPDVPVRFYVIGSPIYSTVGSQFSEAELRQLASELGLSEHVGFIPFQAAMAPVYRALDVVVHASTHPEPFGRTVAEAMGCGRPLIVAEEGGVTELFTPNVSALGCVPRSIEALADAMAILASDPERARSLGVQARSEAEQKFDRRRLGADLLRLYEGVLGTH